MSTHADTHIGKVCALFRQRNEAQWRTASEVLVDLTISRDLEPEEVADVAVAIAASGEELALEVRDHYCDIPSTGGPASLSTLLCPVILNAAGVRVPKISASGSVAGGIDTLALVPGYRHALSPQDFVALVRDVGIAHSSQTASLCPADRTLVRVRRERGLMENRFLAAASLLSKKIAVSKCPAVFDFRIGETGNVGATRDAAIRSAELFHAVAERLGLPIGTVLTDNTTFPCSALGRIESLELTVRLLRRDQSALAIDAAHLTTCLTLTAEALTLVKRGDARAAAELAHEALASGRAEEAFYRHLSAQGGSRTALDDLLRRRQQDIVHRLLADGGKLGEEPATSERGSRGTNRLQAEG
jgi:thymidine phosphorylase